ncbi:Dimerisation domain-containing protein [Nonomuraea solani]|uniref:Dimerisation domain-containing protein n=1 Tax=Nonomuraea solani TaxID=1144553 RepID=A0A1H5SU87_9ACTN|nr:methyltransferase [Nonomuraea solani]SEF53347.1 Dimerisation domain-containing protein [Nonomuraea solani]
MPLFYNALEAGAHRLSIVPPMFDYFGALGLHALVAAARMGVFDALGERPSTAGELAAALNLDPHATGVLLRSLAGLGYLRSRGGRYRLTRTARSWFTTDSPTSLVAGLEFWERTACVIWPRVEKAVRDGAPGTPFYTLLESDPELSRSFQAWTGALARRQAPAVARVVPVPRGAARVLDVGGGHGWFGMELLRRHPGLRATVIDLPRALEAAADHPRLTLRPGSFLDDDLGAGYDVVLLFNVLHGLDDREAATLLARLAAALGPGGTIVVGDQFGDSLMPGRASRALLRLLDLNYLVAAGGRVREFGEVSGLLRAAGFGRPRHRRPLRSAAMELAISRLM